MIINPVGTPSVTGAVTAPLAGKAHHARRCGCESGTRESAAATETKDDTVARTEGHQHDTGQGHERHGRGFGLGHFAPDVKSYIQEQRHAAYRQISGEQIAEAVNGLSTQVSGVIAGAGVQEELGAAQERFNQTMQDVVGRLDSGEIDRTRAMDGFRAAFEALVDAVRTGSADESATVEAAGSVDASGAEAGTLPAGDGTDPAGETAAAGGSLVDSLGQAFNAFMEDLRPDFMTGGSMHSAPSPENRASMLEALVSRYRELAGLDSSPLQGAAETADIDQLA
jgi:hypothetical protein